MSCWKNERDDCGSTMRAFRSSTVTVQPFAFKCGIRSVAESPPNVRTFEFASMRLSVSVWELLKLSFGLCLHESVSGGWTSKLRLYMRQYDCSFAAALAFTTSQAYFMPLTWQTSSP